MKLALALATAMILFAQQGDDGYSDDPHPTEPKCSNFHDDRGNSKAPAYHKCECRDMLKDAEKDCDMGRAPHPAGSCRHYCRTDKCGCLSVCTS